MISLRNYTNAFSVNFKSGDMVCIYFLTQIQRKLIYFKKRAKRIFLSRKLRGKRRIWQNVIVRRGYKFWRWNLVLGRVLFINGSVSGVTVGLQIHKNNQFVMATFLLNAVNVIGVRRVGDAVKTCRKNLTVLVTQRKRREKRVWPLRRMCKINHIVK